MKDVYAVICARKGSKRLKNKNLMLVEGKPLIAYTIEAALESSVFSKVFVNSESSEILEVSKNYGAESYQRPQKFSQDTIYIIEVIQEMIASLHLEDHIVIGILFPTCPLRDIQDIRNALNIYYENKEKSPVVSVSTYDYPIQVALTINDKNRLEFLFPEDYKRSTRHNFHPKTYLANYAVIFNKVGTLKKQNNLIGDSPIPYVMPPERSIDIDEPFQMEVVKALMAYRR